MLGSVFSVICLGAFVWSLFAGTTAEAAASVLDGAGRAVEVTLSLVGMMSLWSGVMAVLRDAGAIGRLSGILLPVTRRLFHCDAGREEAVACIAANFIGIGNAATPLGIRALTVMQRGREQITADAMLLTLLCCSSWSPIPTTVLALRRAAGAEVLFGLLPAVWLTGCIGTAVSVILAKLFGGGNGH